MWKRISLLASIIAMLAVAALWSAKAEGDATGVIDAERFESLQAAIDAVPAGGGLLRLPPGRFEITQPLVINHEDIRIVGAGSATHIVNRNENGEAAIRIQPPGFDPAKPRAEQRRLSIWRVQLADFRVSGNPKSGDGVLAHFVNEIYIHGLSVDHNGANGVHLVECYEDPRVADSIFTYNAAAGLNIEANHDIVVSANQFEENQDAVRCVDSFNLCLTGNNIDDHLRHGVVVENTYGSVISGNMIEECEGSAIILDRDAYGITISANVLAHNESGIDLRDAWGSAVSANTFTIIPTWALRIGPNSGRIAVTGNTFANSYFGGGMRRVEDFNAEWPKKGHASGILVESASDIAITGNVFSGLADEAVRTAGASERLALVGNVATDLYRRSGGRGPAFSGPAIRGATVSENAVAREHAK